MKRLATLILSALLAAAPARAAIDALDNVPAATLLLPYFAVDLGNPNAHTLARIGNVSGSEVLAHIVLWTDRGVPTYAFDLRLAAHDVGEIDLRAIFATGALPPSSAGGFASCSSVLPPPALAAGTLSALRSAHRGRASALLGGNCGGVAYGDNLIRGYMTVDAANHCSTSTTFPATPGYFVNGGAGIASNDNVLFGEYASYDSAIGFAHGDALVAIEASATDPATDGPDNQYCLPSFTTCPNPTPFTIVPDYTFYRRLTGSTTDNREGLPQRWFGRYQNDAPAAQTTAVVWRDPGPVTAFPCGNPPTGLTTRSILAFDEQENPAQDCPLVVGSFPYSAQAVALGDPDKISVPFESGFIAYELQRTLPAGDLGIRNQAFVAHVIRQQSLNLPLPLPPQFSGVETRQAPAWPLGPIFDRSELSLPSVSCPQCSDGIDNDGDGKIDFPSDAQCRAASGVESPECSDGIDNDNDGNIDFPADAECWGPLDRIEQDQGDPDNPQCDDGVDNDLDGLIDWPNDPRCFNNPLFSESEGICGNGIDDDGDGKIDYPSDLGCTSRFDGDENNPQCIDGIDNDGDGKIDFPADPGCASAQHPTESPACDDGIDNDGDGKTDFPDDPGCASASATKENPLCDDGIDNDGDGKTDFPDDPACASRASEPEIVACDNGVDDDQDGAIDFPADTSCSAGSDTNESLPTQCGDGVDNDGNGLTDFPDDPGCESATDPFEVPDCRDQNAFAGLDNDFDGLANYPQDPGCASPDDYNELAGTITRQCSDGVDNDGDGRVDYPEDSGCTGRGDDLEYVEGDTRQTITVPPGGSSPRGPVTPVPGFTLIGLLTAAGLLALAGLFGLWRTARRS